VLPKIVAHRGASGSFPENTLAAFDAARSAGAEGIEFDVQLTADRVPVVYHDRTLTKVASRRSRIGDHTWDELRGIDVGAWFQPRFRGQRLPRLDEVLARYGGAIPLMVEIKVDADESRARRNALVDATLAELAAQGRGAEVFVLSFDADVLARVRKRAPHLRCVLDRDDAPPRDARSLRSLRGLHAVCFPARALRRDLPEVLAEAGVKTWVYRCDTELNLARALRWRVDALITDWPSWALKHRVRT